MTQRGGADQPVRPTLRCIDDLGIPVPPMRQALHDIDHPVIVSAQQLPDRVLAGGAERVRELTDRVWFKDRAGDWRSATTELIEGDEGERASSWWVGAAGRRRKGSNTSEPYSSWAADAQRRGSAGRLSTDHLLPERLDWQRWMAEQTVVDHLALETLVPRLIAMSLRGKNQLQATRAGLVIQLRTRASGLGEVYLVVLASGSPDGEFQKRLAMVMRSVPGVNPDDWQPEPPGGWPFRIPRGTIVWSTLLTPQIQGMLLAQYPDDVEVDDVD